MTSDNDILTISDQFYQLLKKATGNDMLNISAVLNVVNTLVTLEVQQAQLNQLKGAKIG